MPTNQQRREAAKRKLERQQERRVQRSQRRKQVAVITAVVVVVGVVGVVFAGVSFLGGGGPAPSDAKAPPSSPAAAPTPLNIPTQIAPPPKRPQAFPATVNCAYPSDGKPPARPARPPSTNGVSAQGTVPATLATSAGQIDLTLDKALAPCTVNSFVSLAKQGYFDNTQCHRLTTSPGLQVLQCGDPTGSGSGGPGYQFADEVFPELTYGRGYLAMANGGPDTNGSQFFMIYGGAEALSPNYTVFGTIGPAGLGVLDTIARAGHDGSMDPNPGGGKPNKDVTITKATAR
ncbi:peptidylprolyl isomerase [Pseudonocardia acaciae]|uniref:peptidylprolyl isomerase n=1 Tax=Pseudonocardia acaciae TaxID=551276 RepID=UPI00048A7DEF|nr:peptidylprolyl isomerase [Pseudonocardia acaciae]